MDKRSKRDFEGFMRCMRLLPLDLQVQCVPPIIRDSPRHTANPLFTTWAMNNAKAIRDILDKQD